VDAKPIFPAEMRACLALIAQAYLAQAVSAYGDETLSPSLLTA
jgi:hypothetical protein